MVTILSKCYALLLETFYLFSLNISKTACAKALLNTPARVYYCVPI